MGFISTGRFIDAADTTEVTQVDDDVSLNDATSTSSGYAEVYALNATTDDIAHVVVEDTSDYVHLSSIYSVT